MRREDNYKIPSNVEAFPYESHVIERSYLPSCHAPNTPEARVASSCSFLSNKPHFGHLGGLQSSLSTPSVEVDSPFTIGFTSLLNP